MILLDTSALIWFILGDRRLGSKARDHLTHSFERNEACLAPISFWEAAMLVRKGRVVLGQPVRRWADGLIAGGIQIAALTPDIAIRAGELPDDIHGDPADRIIVATAQLRDKILVTSDRKILAYAQAGHVQAIDARR